MQQLSKQQWLEQRQTGLGGSDMPVVMGASPFRTAKELWLEKTGQLIDIPETPAMKRGRVLEPVAANLYSDVTGRKLRNLQGPIRHKKLNFLLCDIDRHIVAPNPQKGPGSLSIKCPGLKVFSKCKLEGLPDYYVIQLQHELEVMEWNWGSFCVFNAERWEMLHFDMERDQELIDIIKHAGIHFWELVKSNTPPEEADKIDIDMPKVGGELVKVSDADMSWAAAVNELKEAKEIMEQAKALEETCKTRILEMMRAYDAEVIEGAGARIYWREQTGRKTLDKKAMLADGIDLSKYEKVGQPFRTFRSYFLTQTIQE